MRKAITLHPGCLLRIVLNCFNLPPNPPPPTTPPLLRNPSRKFRPLQTRIEAGNPERQTSKSLRARAPPVSCRPRKAGALKESRGCRWIVESYASLTCSSRKHGELAAAVVSVESSSPFGESLISFRCCVADSTHVAVAWRFCPSRRINFMRFNCMVAALCSQSRNCG